MENKKNQTHAAQEMAMGMSMNIAAISFLMFAYFSLSYGGWLAPVLVVASWMASRLVGVVTKHAVRNLMNLCLSKYSKLFIQCLNK